jgi:hypothetical protein
MDFESVPLSQKINEEIDVSTWKQDEDHGIYPEGAREKTLFLAPSKPPFQFLKQNHPYLFKKSMARHPQQFWMEVIAFEIGKLAGISVPPSYAAFNGINNQSGALVEWFFLPSSKTLHRKGGEYMQENIQNYDLTKGTQHNFETILIIGEHFEKHYPSTFVFLDWLTQWAKIVVFDALIGNTDRHHDNWGVLFESPAPPKLTPAFDNGTSLGYEILDQNIFKFNDPNYLNKYINRGYHHMKWALADKNQCGHLELVENLVQKYPFIKKETLATLAYCGKALKSRLEILSTLKIPVTLTKTRYEFILRLTEARRQKLIQVLS